MTTWTRRPSPLRRALPILLLLGLLGLAACSAGDDAGSADGGLSADEAPAAGDSFAEAGTVDRASGSTSGGAPAARPAAQVRAVISTGSVSLRADEVGAARDRVVAIGTGRGGEIQTERSLSDEAGEMESSALVLRIPSAGFEEAMDELEEVADYQASTRNSKDVTTQVIDVDTRVRAQERSIRRIEVLLDRAEDIPDVVRVEGELTRRQAALESLRNQQTYLADQTSLATIEVSIVRTDAPEPPAEEESGFLAGLDAGWTGLKAFTVGLLTVLGALLPFLAVVLVLAWPTWLLVRRVVRRPLGVPAATLAAPALDGDRDAE